VSVLLFSGHMIDAKGRPTPRFPPDKEETARAAIGGSLDLHLPMEEAAFLAESMVRVVYERLSPLA
jgi:hypothetical protein